MLGLVNVFIVIIAICLFICIYETLTLFITFPDHHIQKRILRISNKMKKKGEIKSNTLLTRIALPIFRQIKTLRLFNYDDEKLKNQLEKAGITDTPEIFYAKGIMYCIISAILALLSLVILRTTFFFLVFTVVAILSPIIPTMELKGKIKKINEGILKDFPAFVTALRHQYGRGKTLNSIIQSYCEVAEGGLKFELQKLAAELEMMSDNDALLRFADRVGLSDISNFAHALVFGQLYGMDVDSIFALQDQEMRRLNRDNIRKTMKKKPLILTAILAIPVLNIMLILGLPPLINLFSNINF